MKDTFESLKAEKERLDTLRGNHDQDFQAAFEMVKAEVAPLNLTPGQKVDIAWYRLWLLARKWGDMQKAGYLEIENAA